MKRTFKLWWPLVDLAVWCFTLHYGFDLGRDQGWPHGFVRDVLPAAIGLTYFQVQVTAILFDVRDLLARQLRFNTAAAKRKETP